MSDHEITPQLRPTDRDEMIPLDFFDVFVNRYLPVLSCTYVAVVFGLALKKGGLFGFIPHFFGDKSIYWLALIVATWVSIPAVVWIIMRGIGALEKFANSWYKSTTMMLVIVLASSFILFPPTGQASGIWVTARLFIAAAVPVHAVQYWFFRHGGLETFQSTLLSAFALALMLYGLIII